MRNDRFYAGFVEGGKGRRGQQTRDIADESDASIVCDDASIVCDDAVSVPIGARRPLEVHAVCTTYQLLCTVEHAAATRRHVRPLPQYPGTLYGRL